jgi:hypothetical protein
MLERTSPPPLRAAAEMEARDRGMDEECFEGMAPDGVMRLLIRCVARAVGDEDGVVQPVDSHRAAQALYRARSTLRRLFGES